MPTITTLAQQLRDAVEAKDAEEIQRIINAFQDRADVLNGDIDALARDLEVTPTNKIKNLQSYKRFIAHATDELNRYTEFLRVELAIASSAFIALALQDSVSLMGAAGVASTSWEQAVIENLLGYLQEGGALYNRLNEFTQANVERLTSLILNGVQFGKNPIDTANLIVRDGLGMSLTDAMRMTRTLNLYSYREATRANYLKNQDVVQGWVWMSALIPDRTCMSCVAMHGTIHPLTETLNDHHNGLCAMLPLTGDNPIIVNGEEWFNSQSEAIQRKMMGPGKYEAWQNGLFSFDQLSTTYENDVYGTMRVESSLQSLVNQ